VEHRAPPDDRLVLGGEEPHGDAAHAVGLGRHEHLVDDHGRVLHAQHAGDREAPHVGVDHRHVAPSAGERHGQVGGHRGLADPALARGDQEHPGLAAGIGERDRPALGVAVGLLAAGGGGRVAVQHGAERGPLVVGHDREVEVDRVDAVEGGDGPIHPVGDLGPEGAAGDGERHGHGHAAAVDLDAPDHVELDDAAVQLGVLDRAEGLEDLVFGDGHHAPGSGRSACRRPGERARRRTRDFHYGDR